MGEYDIFESYLITKPIERNLYQETEIYIRLQLHTVGEITAFHTGRRIYAESSENKLVPFTSWNYTAKSIPTMHAHYDYK